MTPTIFPVRTASAMPEGSRTALDALAGVVPGQAAAGESSGDGDFADFDVALLSVLDRVSIDDTPEASLADLGESVDAQGPSNTTATLTALWLQSFNRTSGEDTEPDAAASPSADEQDALETDEQAITAAALAAQLTTPVLPVEGTSSAIERVFVDGTAPSGTDDTADSADAEAIATAQVVQAKASVSHAAGQLQATVVPEASIATDDVTSDDDDVLPAETREPAARSGQDNRSLFHTYQQLRGEARRATETAVLERTSSTARQTATDPESTTTQSARSTVAAALQDQAQAATSAEESEAGDEGKSAEQKRLEQAAQVSVVPAVGAPHSSSNSSSDAGHDDRHARADADLLRRASSIESRLTSPTWFSFSMPTAPVATEAQRQVLAAATQFEMPAPAENLSSLVQSIRVQAREGMSQATVRLNPEHLGEVTIAIRVDSGTVTAVVRAEAGDVRQWLRGQEDSIRTALADQGLTLDKLVVEQDGRRQGDQEQEQADAQRRQRARRQGTRQTFELQA